MKNIRANKYKEIYGEKLPSTRENLEYYASLSPNQDIPKYYVHFSQINKVGINPQQDYNSTPLGIYFHPLNDAFLKNKTVFAYQHEYIFVVQPDPGANIIHMQKNKNSIGATSADIDFMLTKMEKHIHPKWMDVFLLKFEYPSFQDLYCFIRLCFLKWGEDYSFLLSKTGIKDPLYSNLTYGTKGFAYFLHGILGIDGISDTRNSYSNAIVSNEPQLVVFRSNVIDIIDSFQNDTHLMINNNPESSQTTAQIFIYWMGMLKFKTNYSTPFKFIGNLIDYLGPYQKKINDVILAFPKSALPLPIDYKSAYEKLNEKIPIFIKPEQKDSVVEALIEGSKDDTLQEYVKKLNSIEEQIISINTATEKILRKNTLYVEFQDYCHVLRETVFAAISEYLECLIVDAETAKYYVGNTNETDKDNSFESSINAIGDFIHILESLQNLVNR